MIFLWVQDELSFDRFHEETDRLFRTYSKVAYSDGRKEVAANSFYRAYFWNIPGPLHVIFPEVEEFLIKLYGFAL